VDGAEVTPDHVVWRIITWCNRQMRSKGMAKHRREDAIGELYLSREVMRS
jgi:hypothetical protein